MPGSSPAQKIDMKVHIFVDGKGVSEEPLAVYHSTPKNHLMKKLLLSALCTASFLAVAATASAQSAWVGTTTDFGTASNWSPSGVPSGTDFTFGIASGGTYAVDLGLVNRDGGNVTFSNANTTNAYSLSTTSTTTWLRIGSLKTLTVESTTLAHTVDRLSSAGNVAYAVDIQGASTNFAVTENFRTDRAFTKNGAGTFTISGTSTIGSSFGVTINGGTIDLTGGNWGNGGSSPAYSGLTSTAGTVLTNSGVTQRVVHFGDGVATALTASGNITGNLRYAQGRSNAADTRVQIMAGTNTYTGNTTVNSGTLLINGSHTGGADYVVLGSTTAATAILGGNGTINVGANNILIGDAVTSGVGRLQPGSAANTIGTLTTTAASLNFAAESIFTIDLNTIGSNTIDLINQTGNLSITSGATLSLNQLGGFNAATFFNGTVYTFLDYSGTSSGSFTLDSGSATLLSSNGYSLFDNTVTGQLQLVPEPSTWALLAFSVTTIIVFRRRRRS